VDSLVISNRVLEKIILKNNNKIENIKEINEIVVIIAK
jgi:hypothetical protein